MAKFTKYLQYVLLAICAIVVVLFYVQSGSGVFALENLSWTMENTSMVDGLLWWTYALLLISIVLVVVLSIIGMINDTSSLKSTGFTVLIAVVLVGVSYVFASGDPVLANIAKQPSFATLKMTDTGLILTYILMAISLLAIVGGAIMNIIKNR